MPDSKHARNPERTELEQAVFERCEQAYMDVLSAWTSEELLRIVTKEWEGRMKAVFRTIASVRANCPGLTRQRLEANGQPF